MPPIKSIRPGARLTTISADGEKKPGNWASRVARVRLDIGNFQQVSTKQRVAEQRLDLRTYLRVRVAGPGDVRLDCEACVQRDATNVGHEHTGFACDQLGTQIVWMATDTEHKPAI